MLKSTNPNEFGRGPGESRLSPEPESVATHSSGTLTLPLDKTASDRQRQTVCIEMNTPGGASQAPVGSMLFTPIRMQQSTPESRVYSGGYNAAPIDGHGYFSRSQRQSSSPHYQSAQATPTSAGRRSYADNMALSPMGSRDGSLSRTRSVGIGSYTEVGAPPMRSLDPWASPGESMDMSTTPQGAVASSNGVHNLGAALRTSPIAFSTPASSQPSQAASWQHPGSTMAAPLSAPWQQQAQEPAGPANGNWVTVFGFAEKDKSLILQEFQKHGEIVNFIYPKPGCNWMYLEYRSKYDADKAIKCDRAELIPGFRIGVQPLDASGYREVQERKLGGDVISPASAPSPPLPKTSPVVRPYHVEARNAHVGVPQPTRTTWNKVQEYIFG
eukprot:947234-Prorocentrum_minimum.AAC.1